MSVKSYILHCDFCGYKRFTDGTDVADLVSYKESNIPGGVPYIDPVSKKIVNPKSFARSKKFKCPKCGRIISARKTGNTSTGNDDGRDWLE